MPETPDLASSPCYADQIPAPVETADVPGWRKAMRTALIAARQAVPAEGRARAAQAVAVELDALIAPAPGVTISLYWPFRGELDLRGWMASAQGKGARIALPLVTAKGQPLTFRAWWPGCAMERGIWNILQPSGTPELVPDVVIAPLVGFDPDLYRLGYGGGFFDRTLAALGPGVRALGVGHARAALRSIHPQWHDVAMKAIVTAGGEGPARVLLRGW